MAGDDLDDDYAPDALVALSDDEAIADRLPLDEEDAFIADDEIDHGTNDVTSAVLVSTADALKEKKRKRKAKDNERKAKVPMTPSSTHPLLICLL